jgi:hypothetical protein
MMNLLRNNRKNCKEIKLGLHIPLFSASLVTLLVGAPLLGLIGVWMFAQQGEPVPHFLKVSHAHVAWWSVALLISSLIMPALPLKRIVKRIIAAGAFFILPLYALSIALHYNSAADKLSLPFLGELFVTPYGFASFALELIFFAVMLGLALMAAGVRFPKFLQSGSSAPTRYELASNVSVPGKAFGAYAFFLSLAIIIGFYILANFTLQYKPITPAALVQFHTHMGIFAIGFLMVLIAMRAVGVSFSRWLLTYNLGIVSLAATALGFLIFIIFNTHSIAWVLPAMLYFAVLVLGWISLLGKFGLRPPDDNYFHFTRWALIVIWGFLLIFTLAGPYLAAQYSKTPDLTVTYKQPGGGIGGKHIGSYPDPKTELQETAPVKGNPRGLENFHLSPGSWAHVAIFWLLILMLFGKRIFQTIGAPTLLFVFAVTIAQAPIINGIGRIGAWLGHPAGAGPLLFVAHPLKTLNILALLIVMIVLMVKLRNQQQSESNNELA